MILLLLLLSLAQKGVSSSINGSSIYGVRWFLAEKFRFQQPITVIAKQDVQSHLMLYFNTFQKWPSHNFTVQIQSTSYKCRQVQVLLNITADHHKNFNQFASTIGQIYPFFIYKCPVLFKNEAFLCKNSQFTYQIFANSASLFKSQLRSPSFNQQSMQMTVFGDWGALTNYSKQSKLSKPITECLAQQIQQNKNIRMMLLLGDIGYDMQGASYVNFFNYLQPFSKQLVIVLTPGNHQTIKHKDIFELVKQSFYSPFWPYFYGYFDLIQLGKYVLIGLNSQGLFPALARDSHSSLFEVELKQDYQSHYNLFAMQLPQTTKNKLKQYNVIAYSHYPIYCSEEDQHESCNNYLSQHRPYLEQLQSINTILYFSGHLHVYERSKQICPGGSFKDANDLDNSVYGQGNCTIFIVQGVGGNNYYVSTQQHFNLKSHTQKTVLNTGFGVLKFDSNNQTNFKHILGGHDCKVADQIVLIPSTSRHTTKKYIKWIILINALIIIVLLIRVIRLRMKKRKSQVPQREKNEKSQTNIIQLIQAE